MSHESPLWRSRKVWVSFLLREAAGSAPESMSHVETWRNCPRLENLLQILTWPWWEDPSCFFPLFSPLLSCLKSYVVVPGTWGHPAPCPWGPVPHPTPKDPLLRRTLPPSPSPQLSSVLCSVRRKQSPPHRAAVVNKFTSEVLRCCLPLWIKWFNSLPSGLQLLVGKGLPYYGGPGDMTAEGQSLWKNSARTILVCAKKARRLCYHPRHSNRCSHQGFILTSHRNWGISVWIKEWEGHLLKAFCAQSLFIVLFSFSAVTTSSLTSAASDKVSCGLHPGNGSLEIRNLLTPRRKCIYEIQFVWNQSP